MAGEMEGKVILATDLSARCDRALGRASMLAAAWSAELVVVHALEPVLSVMPGKHCPSWRRPPDPVTKAKRHVLDDLTYTGIVADVHVERGEPAEVVADAARRENAALIIAGAAQDEPFGRFRLGGTIDRLIREVRRPLLIVRDRPRRSYQRLVIATDFRDHYALQAAAEMFPTSSLAIFHAHRPYLTGLEKDPALVRGSFEAIACQDALAYLARTSPEVKSRIADKDVLVEEGDPAALLSDYLRQDTADLVIVGTRARNVLVEFVLGSVAKRIVDDAPCDVLLIPAPD